MTPTAPPAAPGSSRCPSSAAPSCNRSAHDLARIIDGRQYAGRNCGFDPTHNYSWTFLTATGVVFNPAGFTVDTLGLRQPDAPGHFSVTANDQSLVLNYTAPEPSTFVLAALGVTVGCVAQGAKRRRSKSVLTDGKMRRRGQPSGGCANRPPAWPNKLALIGEHVICARLHSCDRVPHRSAAFASASSPAQPSPPRDPVVAPG